jgi:hypothetical protein
MNAWELRAEQRFAARSAATITFRMTLSTQSARTSSTPRPSRKRAQLFRTLR